MSDTEKTPAERLAAAQEQAEKRAKAREDARALREVAALELEAKYEAEIGPLGQAFTVIRTVDGPIALKLHDVTFMRKLAAVKKVEEADLFDFVKPALLFPDLEAFKTMIQTRGDLLGYCALRVKALHEGLEEEARGK